MSIKKEINEIIQFQLSDNVKACELDQDHNNIRKQGNSKKKVRVLLLIL